MLDLPSDVEFSGTCEYFSTENFNLKYNRNKNLSIIHQNIRSFAKNFDVFSIFLKNIVTNWDVIVFTETWFNEGTSALLPGYKGFHTYRDLRRGGGVSIYVREDNNCFINSEWSLINSYIELVSVTLVLNNVKINIMALYRPPDGDVQQFLDFLDNKILSKISPNNNSIMLGDFNIDLLKSSNIERDFVNLCRSCCFLPYVNKPTRVMENNNGSLIDHIWSNRTVGIEAGVFLSDITDHYSIFCFIDIKNPAPTY